MLKTSTQVSKMNKPKTFEEEAEKHWEWLEKTLHRIYVDAMVHGYKHGYDDAKKERDK